MGKLYLGDGFMFYKNLAQRRGSTFLSNTWRKKMSYSDEIGRMAKNKHKSKIIIYSNNTCINMYM